MSTVVLSPAPSPHPEGPPAPVRSRLPGRVTLRRLARYTGVSAISTSTSLCVLFVLVGVVGLPATWSNVVATAVGTVPSFELNRRWVWHGQGRRSLLGQIIPFTTLSFTGLLVSTVAVGVVSGRTSGWSHWEHTLAVEVANLAAYGSLWVVQYVVLDRFLFRTRDRDRDRPMAARGAPTFTGREQNAPSRVGPTEPMLVTGAQPPAVPDPRRDRSWMNTQTTSGSPSRR
jgi:putative flippase GtrA